MVYNAPYAQAPLLPPNSQYLPTICNTSTANQVNNSLTNILLLVVIESNLIFNFIIPPGGGGIFVAYIVNYCLCLCSMCLQTAMGQLVVACRLSMVQLLMYLGQSCVLDHVLTVVMNLSRRTAVAMGVLVSCKKSVLYVKLMLSSFCLVHSDHESRSPSHSPHSMSPTAHLDAPLLPPITTTSQQQQYHTITAPLSTVGSMPGR